MKLKIAHIINPVIVPEASDLYLAQPVTFETMRLAKEKAADKVDVLLCTAQYEEDESMVPEYFIKTPNLERSILDLGTFKKQRKLPLIKSILDNLYEASEGCDYMIYTNVDIGLQPSFYLEVQKLIEKGYDAFVINRRTISKEFDSLDKLEGMFAEDGKKHPGYDCFVFKRSAYPNYKFEETIIGTNWIGWVIITNLLSFSNKFKIFKDLRLTFHIGEDRVWKSSDLDDYSIFNRKQYEKAAFEIKSIKGKIVNALRHKLGFKYPNLFFIARMIDNLVNGRQKKADG